MDIRSLQLEDVSPALTLVWQVFCEFEAPDYSEQGIREFKSFISCTTIQKRMKAGELKFWGCFDSSRLTGVIATRNTNHICLLFVRKEHHRKGIARRLFAEVLKFCRVRGFHEITVNSSPYAVEAYHRLGFADTNSEQTVNGIRFVPMRYLF